MTPSAITLIVTPTAQPATTTEVTTRTAHARSGDHLRGQSYPGSSALTRPHPTAIGSTSSGEWPLSHLRDCRQTSVVTGCHQGEINIRTRAVPQAVLRPIPQRTAWRPAPAEACRGRTRTPSAPASWGATCSKTPPSGGAAASRRAAPHERTGRRPPPRGTRRAVQRAAFHRSDEDLQAVPTALEAMAHDARSPAAAARGGRRVPPRPAQRHPQRNARPHGHAAGAWPAHMRPRRARPRSRHRSRTQPPGRTRRRPRPCPRPRRARPARAPHRGPLDERRQSSPAVTVIGTCD